MCWNRGLNRMVWFDLLRILVGKINRNPKIAIQKLENLNTCLKFLESHDLKMVNIGSSDIMNGNEKIILGLLWTIILRFEVADAQGKQGLLLWVKRSVNGYEGVNVHNFTDSFSDGLALNALIHRYRPDLLDFNALNAADKMGNCEQAFKIAEGDLGISRLLDPEDVVEAPDEKSMVAYLSQFFKLFAGQVKVDALRKAVKNAVEVTQRHDEWIEQYLAAAGKVCAFAEESILALNAANASSTTEDVSATLDQFTLRMKDTKPKMQALRAEMEGTYATLVSSKRNNKRPEFVPPENLAMEVVGRQWEAMGEAEQMYERQLVDKFISFQRADRAVSKFVAKADTVEAWLDEKIATMKSDHTASSVQEVEALIEVHRSFTSRLQLYERVVTELQNILGELEEPMQQGHAGAKLANDRMSQLRSKVDEAQELGKAHLAALEKALEEEKRMVAVTKEFLEKSDQLDFEVDELHGKAHESIEDGLTLDLIEKMLLDNEGTPSRISATKEKLTSLQTIAEQLSSRRPEAMEQVNGIATHLEEIANAVAQRESGLREVLEQERRKTELKHKFAEKAKALDSAIEKSQSALAGLSGTLEEQRGEVAQLKEKVTGLGKSDLENVRQVLEECEVAGIKVNEHTSHTIYSLTARYEQFLKALNKAEESLLAQALAKQSLELSPEQLKEVREVFVAFDQDKDGVIDLGELKEAILAVGIDMDDAELCNRFANQDSISLDAFINFFVEENKTGDGMEDVLNAFKELSGGDVISPDGISKNFGMQTELLEYLNANIKDGDYNAFTQNLFTR